MSGLGGVEPVGSRVAERSERNGGERSSGVRLRLAEAMLSDDRVADAYVALLGELRLSPALASGNAVLVTSAAPGDGKTTVAACLSLTAAKAGRSVLLIDGDLRRATLTHDVGATGEAGLVELLIGEIESGAFRVDSLDGGVSFLSGGAKPPAVLAALDWPKARGAFRSMTERFGLVILDSPPVLAASDALLFARIVDAVILVVGAGDADLSQVKQAKEQLEAAGAPVVGAVLNRFGSRTHGPSHRPYSGYYREASR